MRAFRFLVPSAALALALISTGCSPEKKAAGALEDYEVAFKECKKITEEAGIDPGTHYCTKITSMALEMSLEETGLDAAAQKKTIEEWVKSSDLGEYYADEAAREDIPSI